MAEESPPKAATGSGRSGQLYDAIGVGYTTTRSTDPRIAAQIWGALGDARTVLNVGAGTGSYEPTDRAVLAVEPSGVMRAQRRPDAAPCIAATAERLPFKDNSFDAAMAVTTIHHWPDPIAGLREMRRVARRVVVFTFDVERLYDFWLVRDYLPETAGLFVGRPTFAELVDTMGATVVPVPIPWDCADGFLEAYWRRPAAYLDDEIRRGMSVWPRLGAAVERRVVDQLRGDLASGRWLDRNGELLDRETAELGLYVLVA